MVAAVIAGPAGLGLVTSAWGLGAIGGAVGGAVTGGLEGGWKGAMFGALAGGALGGLGGWGYGITYSHGMAGQFIAGSLIAGAGVAAATDSLDSFAGGLVGGLAGAGIGKGITNAYSEQFANYRAGNGFVSNRTAAFNQYEAKIEAMHALNVNKADSSVKIVSRPLGGKNGPGSLTGPRHNAITSGKLPNGKWEMGPGAGGIIQTTDTVGNLGGWSTHMTTEQSLALGGRYAIGSDVAVNFQGLQDSINLYNSTIAGNWGYSALNHNSNYAVNSVIYGAGGTYQGNSYRAPGFPNGP